MAKKTPSAADALKKLKDGNKRFSTDKPVYERHDSETRAKLPGGQDPFAIVLSCADSRVIPELIFDAGLSELFVIRVAGNIANTCSIASIEYAVAHLNVNLVVVLGHEGCGAVDAALGGGDNGYNLNHLLAHLQPAVAKPTGKDHKAKLKNAVKKNAKLTAKDLRDRSSILSKKSLKIVPAYYNLASGKVNFL